MYWESFGFKEAPFALTPNPAFLFLSSPHQEALAHLLFAIENRVGFIELSGEVGTGKTTLVRTLLNQLDPEKYRTALIFNPTLSPFGLLQEINSEYGIASAGADMRELHQALNQFLLEENRCGRTVVLVIDEAQNLAVEVLEQIRLISNLETESDKLIQIVMVGQPELNQQLARPELRQLDQRITVRYHLTPMGFTDTCDYIRHRVKFAAGGREPLTFSAGAQKKIFSFSGGLPRLINSVCDRALLLAYTRECVEVSPPMAATAIADLRKDAPRPALALWTKLAAAGAAAAVIAIAAFILLPGKAASRPKRLAQPSPQVSHPEPHPQVKPAAAPAASLLSPDAALQELAASSEQENLYSATNAVLAAWQSQPVQPVVGRSATLGTLARERRLVATTLSGNLEALTRLDAPALLKVPLAGGAKRLVAVTGYGKDSVTVAPPLAGHSQVSRAELAQIWSGEATLLWKDFHSLLPNGKKAETAEKVKLLQGLLKEAGCYQGQVDGRGGSKTRAAIAEFQRREQLTADGRPSPQTLMLLYRRAGGFFPPGSTRPS